MRTRGTAQAVAFTVWAKSSSPASVWNMMCRRRLWKSVQLEALVTWGCSSGQRASAVGAPPQVPLGAPAEAHLAKASSAWHPGLDVILAVGWEAQLLSRHVQDSVAKEDKGKVSGARRVGEGTGDN